jgi:hypothetical protein
VSFRRNGVLLERGRLVGVQRVPDQPVHAPGDGKIARLLEGRERFGDVVAEFAVDLAAGEMSPVEQNLGAQDRRPFVIPMDVGLPRTIDQHRVEPRLLDSRRAARVRFRPLRRARLGRGQRGTHNNGNCYPADQHPVRGIRK